MKLFALVTVILLGLSCKTHKNAKSASVNNDGSLIGIVHINENNCPVFLSIEEKDNPGTTLNFKKAIPLNLKDGMKKKGLKVKFSYTISKALQPEGCNADVVINLESIVVIP